MHHPLIRDFKDNRLTVPAHFGISVLESCAHYLTKSADIQKHEGNTSQGIKDCRQFSKISLWSQRSIA